jgi:acrylyl-CoA reductase (NADPH)
MDLPTSVAPFILRGVTLRGIDSVMASQERRQRAWNALAETLNREHLRNIYQVLPMTQVPELAPRIVDGEVRGRIVIDVNA